MRKLFTSVFALLIAGQVFAGGLVTNTNQSTSWVRLPSRNASTSIDAVFYNPAGLTKLENGFHFSLSNQTIFQTKDVKNFYAGPGGSYGLNQYVYLGDVAAPVYPGVYGAYKKDRFVFSLGFNPIGGGGGAEYKIGLPSFEMTPSDLVPSLQPTYGTSQYRLDAYLKGSSVFFGLQGGVSFKINEWLSVAAGMRYVSARNAYQGHLTDIEVNNGSPENPNWQRADQIMSSLSATYTTAATGSSALVSAGAGSLTFAQAQTLGYITPTERAQFEAGLTALGYPATTPIATADQIYKGAATKYSNNATLLGDQYADVEQTGYGITAIFSANFSPTENLNIGIKYEMKTRMELTNKTTQDFTTGFASDGTPITMFPDGMTTPADMPAMLSVGIDYKLGTVARISLGSNYFWDKTANYGHKVDDDNNSSTPSVFISNKDIIDHNGLSFHGGVEYYLSEKLLLSAGYVWANKGVNDKYQSDLTYANATSTVGLGGAYKIMPNLQLNLGFGYTYYKPADNYIDHVFAANGTIYKVHENYGKNTEIISIGLDFSF
jgi:long-subunit fatty acid transport protein